jgi:ABC-type multidrug transport system permease subunit
MWRELMATTRNPADVAGRLLVCAYVGLMVGLVSYNIGSGLEALRSRLNIMYAQILVCLLLPFVYLSLYIADKQYFIADVNAGLYRPSAYYLAKQLVVLPFALVNILLCCCIVYGLAGLTWNPVAFLMYLVFCILVYLVASQVGDSRHIASAGTCRWLLSHSQQTVAGSIQHLCSSAHVALFCLPCLQLLPQLHMLMQLTPFLAISTCFHYMLAAAEHGCHHHHKPGHGVCAGRGVDSRQCAPLQPHRAVCRHAAAMGGCLPVPHGGSVCL